MFRFRMNHYCKKSSGKHLINLGLAALIATGSWMLPASPSQAKSHVVARSPERSEKPDPEVLLIGIYKELAANHLRQAQSKADALVEAYPNFRLGHLIRGDLLLMHDRPITTLGAVGNGEDEKLKNLREEAIVRLRSLREKPQPEMMPRSVMLMRDDQKHVILVDAKRSRLYVYENHGEKLKFVADYYISQGKLGVNKIKEGDQKTPIGIYYITSHLRGARLPDFYGSGALPINYPNEWDRINGRSGSGIWLHGTPSDSYSRPPLSSDGCVVLTNPDLFKLTSSVEIGKTPVIISESVDFISKAKWSSDRNIALKIIEEWRRDAESLSSSRLMENYSRRFKSERGEDLGVWFPKQHQFFNGVKNLSLKLQDVSSFFYPGRDDMIVTTFTQQSQIGRSKSSSRKRQYWVKEGAKWKIVYEVNL